ncbi:phosphatidylserine decarboxylase [Flavisolibacter nicotianae]|uniref:phosphatidylserine decarboxylase n=1 Tax=Flavisolibacter nicotianae TaxID=2364882 RepID=UPI000EB5374C|nr:phosphatidylserine decarboxylase [Flavisolibacter nicotianae]
MKNDKKANRFYFSKSVYCACIAITAILFLSCNNGDTQPKNSYGAKTRELIAIVAKYPKMKSLLAHAINKGREINPDTTTNPVKNLEDFYQFVSWAETAMPWDLIRHTEHATLYNRIDQSLGYLFFITDIPLPELEGKGYFNNSLQYEEPFCSWLTSFDKGWGSFLDTKQSWNAAYYKLALSEEKFGLQNDWYEDPSHWETFNQFFTRRLKSPDKRPVSSPSDESIVVSPADAAPQGVWKIDSNSGIVGQEGVPIKTATVYSVKSLIGDSSQYKDAFQGGTITHTFLDVGDYHRYHFPLSGTVKEARVISATNTAGGYVTWDAREKRYVFNPGSIGWQAIETRGCVILETDQYGLVALLPIGMSPVSSIQFSTAIKQGSRIKKGDEMGMFLFGGSDFVMVFQKQADFTITCPKEEGRHSFKHLLMGERYGKLTLLTTSKQH